MARSVRTGIKRLRGKSVARPSLGNNTNRRIVKTGAGGDNVRTTGIPAVKNNRQRGFGS